jgi:hypothetical protein
LQVDLQGNVLALGIGYSLHIYDLQAENLSKIDLECKLFTLKLMVNPEERKVLLLTRTKGNSEVVMFDMDTGGITNRFPIISSIQNTWCYWKSYVFLQARTGRGIHGLPKVSPGPAKPDPYTAVLGVARPQGGQPAAVFFPLGYPFPYGPVFLTGSKLMGSRAAKRAFNILVLDLNSGTITQISLMETIWCRYGIFSNGVQLFALDFVKDPSLRLELKMLDFAPTYLGEVEVFNSSKFVCTVFLGLHSD